MATMISLETKLPVIEIEDEVKLLSCYTQSIQQAGIRSDPSSIANFYVSLKSRPLVILAGLEGSGKEILIQCLARLLFGPDSYQCQMLTGHPGWAENTSNIPFFVQIHTRFNSEKILSLLEEASQPENYQRVFLASLMHISPAELSSFFADVGYQVQHHEIVRFGDMHLPEPMPFPPNLFLVGTMDVLRFDEWSQDLLSGATVIQWAEQNANPPTFSISTDSLISGEKIFLESCFRDTGAAYRHLHKVLGAPRRSPFEPIFEIRSIIERHDVELPPQITRDVILYLANSWSIYGDGLFDLISSSNLEITTDYAVAQLLLPWILLDKNKSKALFEAIKEYCSARFPASTEQIIRLME